MGLVMLAVNSMTLTPLRDLVILIIIGISILCIIVLLTTLLQLCFQCLAGCYSEGNSTRTNSVVYKYDSYERASSVKQPTTPVKRVNNAKRYSIQYKKLLKQRAHGSTNTNKIDD